MRWLRPFRKRCSTWIQIIPSLFIQRMRLCHMRFVHFQFGLSNFLRLCVYIRLCRVLWRSSYHACLYANATVPFKLRSLNCHIWLQQILYEEMPTKFFFDLLRETDQEFINRTGWFYRHDQFLYVPNSCVLVQPPHLPEGSRPYSPATPNVYPAPFQSPNEPWVYHRSINLGSMTSSSTTSSFLDS